MRPAAADSPTGAAAGWRRAVSAGGRAALVRRFELDVGRIQGELLILLIQLRRDVEIDGAFQQRLLRKLLSAQQNIFAGLAECGGLSSNRRGAVVFDGLRHRQRAQREERE